MPELILRGVKQLNVTFSISETDGANDERSNDPCHEAEHAPMSAPATPNVRRPIAAGTMSIVTPQMNIGLRRSDNTPTMAVSFATSINRNCPYLSYLSIRDLHK